MALIAWYKLDGNALDSSGNGLHGSASNVSWVDGKIAQAGDFNGSSYVLSAHSDTLDTKGSFSVSLWVNMTSIATGGSFTGGVLASKGAHSTRGWHLGIDWNNLYFGVADSSGNSSISVSSINTVLVVGEWHYVTAVYNYSSGFMSIYIDGILKSSGTRTVRNPSCTDNLLIGRGYNYLYGNLDDVRIYDHALSEKEIKELAKAKILHYTFDEFQEPAENLIESIGTVVRCTKSGNGVLIDWATTYGDTYFFFNLKSGTTLTTGDIYTLSFDCSGLPEGKVVTFAWSNVTTILCTLQNGRNELTFTVPSVTSAFFDDIARDATINNLYLYNFQLEKKDHATPFVNGTRTGSVSDNSGYDNHADLALATTPQWVSDSRLGSGAYYFNGSKELVTNKLFFDNVNQEWTAAGWVKLDVNNTYQLFNNFNLGNRIIHSSLKALLYANSGVNDHYVYSSSTIPTNQWIHIAFVYRTSDRTCKFYLNGNLDASSGNYDVTDVPSGFSATTIFGTSLQGYMDDVRIYATALSADDVKELYNTRAQIDNKGNVYSNQINEYGLIQGNNKVFYKNIVSGDYSSSNYSVPGDIAGHSMSFNTNANFKTYIGAYSNPYGDLDKIIKYYVPTTHYVQYAHPTPYYYFTVDPTKTYRYTQWIYRHAEPSSSYSQNCYLGIQGNTVCNNNTTTLNSNPYFTSPAMNDSAYMDKWVLQEFYIFPYGSTGNPTSGKLNYTNGTSINSGGNYNWASGITSSHIRQYPMYEYGEIAAGSYVMHYRPRLDIIDGTEPSIAELVSCGEHIPLIEEDGTDIVEKKGVDANGVFNQQDYSELGPTNGLVAYYPLNGDAKDLVSRNDGTVSGAVVAAGYNGQLCYDFDGVNGDYIRVSTPAMNPINHTITGWFLKRSHTKASYPIFLSYGLPYIACDGSTSPFRVSYTTTGQVSIAGGIVPQLDTWYHVCATFASDGVKMYVNGNLQASSTTPSTNTPSSFDLGRHFGSNTYQIDGKIQNVRIYNRALSAEEIKILYDIESLTAQVKLTSNEMYIAGEFKEAL